MDHEKRDLAEENHSLSHGAEPARRRCVSGSDGRTRVRCHRCSEHVRGVPFSAYNKPTITINPA